MTIYDSIERAVAQIASGGAVVVIDGDRPEGDGSLVFAAQRCTTELLAFMIRHTSGYVCVPIDADTCARVDLLPMPAIEQHDGGTGYTVTVDAQVGTGTGISAADRATTIRLLADPHSTAGDFSRPGHVVPMRVREGGVLTRPGHAEAAVDLARMAGLRPVAVACGIVGIDDPTVMAPADELRLFADRFALPMIAVTDLIAWRRLHEKQVHRVAESLVPTVHGRLRAFSYAVGDTHEEHTALTLGDVSRAVGPTAVALHPQCAFGDVFGALDCDCAAQLEAALSRIAAQGQGVVVYLRGTATRHGHIDRAGFAIASQILDDLGVTHATCARSDHREELRRGGVEITPPIRNATDRYASRPRDIFAS